MELTGLNRYLLWVYDSTNKVITDPDQGGLKTNCGVDGVFSIDLASSYGAIQANVTGLAASTQAVYGSNVKAEQKVGTANPSVALAANDIPHLVYDTLIGLDKDEVIKGGYAQKGSKMVHGGLIIQSHNDNRDIDFYMAFPYGLFTTGELNLQTNNENPTVVHDALTFAAQASGKNSLLYEKFYSDVQDFDFDSMLKAMMAVPSAAQTTTPTTPANGATTNQTNNNVTTPEA